MPNDLLDFSQDSPDQFTMKMGELVQLSLKRSGAFIVVSRGAQEVTTLSPTILDLVPDDDMASALLDVWTEEEILIYLELRQNRREGRT